MKLTYRGANYESNPLATDLVPGGVIGKYRGAICKRNYPRHIPQTHGAAELKYRGANYYVGNPQEIETMVERQQRRDATPVERVNISKQLNNELTRTHLANIRRNLEYRLQVARQRGDQHLIHLLEDEARQLV